MNKDTIVIREIQAKDNLSIEGVIRACFHEFNIPLEGTAYQDPETKSMFEAYQEPNSIYFVVEKNGVVMGGGGLKPLAGNNKGCCEIQKMYFAPEIRGAGYGKLVFEKCLATAKKLGFTSCYIESAPQLKAAIHIYELYGFKHLDGALGNTGHYSCGVWMIKELCD
ncbi:GNAT family N-acetyltransferase [Aestuariibaculum sediminum]|uniref:GNAT family N-acetyltransferase n=1 Tax=Aestuariibaculum sediminum TaxID=2770637 RepID=A0A8J6U809_9FLAO|nr:GNAT family N-acetyltransferase [Aestuariibaculum sediminum]MBD0832620.1 GNAT family N-acetyltransferase [Aestuariibaculum sediminum]